MIFHLKIKLTRLTPAADFQVLGIVFTQRYNICRQIRQRQAEVTNLILQFIQFCFGSIQAFAQAVHFLTQWLDVFPTCFGLTDGFGSGVTLGLQIFSFYLQDFATLFERTQHFHIQFESSACQFFCDCVWLITQQIGIEHAYPVYL